MKTCVKTMASILLLVSFSLAVSRAQEPAKTDAKSEAVKQAVADWIVSFNNHDAHAGAMFFSEDADLTDMRDGTTHGRKNIEQLFQTLFAGPLKNVHRTAVVKSVRFITPTVASVDGDWDMSGIQVNGAVIPPSKGYLVLTMTLQKGHWLIAVFHEPQWGLAAPAQ